MYSISRVGRKVPVATLLLSLAIIYFLLLSMNQDFDRWDRTAKGTSGNIDLIPDWEFDMDSGGEIPEEIAAGLDSAQLKALDSLGIKGLENLKKLDSLDTRELDSLGLGGLDSLGLKGMIKSKKDQRDSTILADPKGYLEGIAGGSLLDRTLKKTQFFLTLIDRDSVYT